MAKLIYIAISSLDGYVSDSDGNFDWSAPDDEVHSFVSNMERQIGTYLYGRRMYEVMRYWETAPTGNGKPSVEQEYAQIWQAADKIVYSERLEQVSTASTRLERIRPRRRFGR
jgi:dihydrofolate reductase